MTVCVVNSLPKVPYKHRIYVCMYGLANPIYIQDVMQRQGVGGA